jgi:hypothetical protein
VSINANDMTSLTCLQLSMSQFLCLIQRKAGVSQCVGACNSKSGSDKQSQTNRER